MRGKKLLLVGEQGLGDEIMFSNILPDAQEAVGETGKLQICVDPRMIPLYQRSYPKAEVGGYDDRTLIDKDGNKALRLIPFASKDNKPDYWAPMGTPCNITARSLADFPHKPFLVPDPARVAEFREEMAALARQEGRHLLAFHDDGRQARQIFLAHRQPGARSCRRPGISFVNLQYGDCAADIARAKEKFGVNIHPGGRPGPEGRYRRHARRCAPRWTWCCRRPPPRPIPPPASARKSGFSPPASAGRSWATAEYPWHADTKVFWPEKFGDWDAVCRALPPPWRTSPPVSGVTGKPIPASARCAHRARDREIVQTQTLALLGRDAPCAASISASAPPAAICSNGRRYRRN